MSIAADALTVELVERFAAALDRLNPQGGKTGLAVSGGPDSMAMMLLAHAAIPGGFEVATVDHSLRPEAKEECALVVAACEERDIPCEVLTVEVGEGNLQAMARAARYEALAHWAEDRNLRAIATAHHADDQAETLLMRLNRGSGVAGLAGVRQSYWTEDYMTLIIRPLLGFRRNELESVTATAGITVAHDPSNDDESYDRVRMRKALAEADWLNPSAIAKSATNLAEANEALDLVTGQLWEREYRRDGDVISIRPHAARVIRLRLIERAIRELGGDPQGGDLAKLDLRLPGSKTNVAGVMVSLIEEEDGLFLTFRPEPPRRTG